MNARRELGHFHAPILPRLRHVDVLDCDEQDPLVQHLVVLEIM